MSAQHTPGPWAYEPTSGAVYYDDGDVEPLIASTNLECVSIEQGDADGRLIAAAPELLEVAKRALSFINSNGKTCKQHLALTADLRAAIAKATGAA